MTDVDGTAEARAPRRYWRLVLLGVLVAAALTSPWWGPHGLRQLAFFRVRKVEIVGARYTPPREVLERLHVDTSRSVWDPLPPLARRVETHPQIAGATVDRRLPGTLVVTLTERQPVALVATRDGLRAVDERGQPLPLDPARVPVDAPVVSAAPRDTTVYRLLGAMLRDAPRLFSRIGSIKAVGRDEMLLDVAGLPVRALTTVTLARLSDIEPVERDLARRRVRPAELDLRYRDQVIARLP
ncbi:MAG: FtsQ-type POTRA domain-containing protein [Gemmatimonadaceae bacterium]|nr:FtsQ-type POTRA domain-containing protein [Gemmatimonadaceae bacterium]